MRGPAQALTQLDSSIDAASAKLQDLRSQREDQAQALQKGRGVLQEARAKIRGLREQLEGASETLQVTAGSPVNNCMWLLCQGQLLQRVWASLSSRASLRRAGWRRACSRKQILPMRRASRHGRP